MPAVYHLESYSSKKTNKQAKKTFRLLIYIQKGFFLGKDGFSTVWLLRDLRETAYMYNVYYDLTEYTPKVHRNFELVRSYKVEP